MFSDGKHISEYLDHVSDGLAQARQLQQRMPELEPAKHVLHHLIGTQCILLGALRRAFPAPMAPIRLGATTVNPCIVVGSTD